jgi:hypothetical protein
LSKFVLCEKQRLGETAGFVPTLACADALSLWSPVRAHLLGGRGGSASLLESKRVRGGQAGSGRTHQDILSIGIAHNIQYLGRLRPRIPASVIDSFTI